jgi:glycosyltransferase involved in cell wall biosynthesis
VKIIIVHHRYYKASGPERYLFNIKTLLEKNGHSVIPFSINYPENEDCEYRRFFIDPVVKNSSFHISKIEKISLLEKLKIVKNAFYNSEAYTKFSQLVLEEKPDLVYTIQFMGKISTSIFDVTQKFNIPVISRLSDYNLICGRNILYREGKICELCISNPYSIVKKRCIQNSVSKSLFFYLSRKYNQFRKISGRINTIIVPSKFTKTKLMESKEYRSNAVVHIPTFIWEEEIKPFIHKKFDSPRFCFLGRVADDKGLEVLLKAFRVLKTNSICPELTIFGDDNSDYGEYLKKLCSEWELDNVKFFGFLSKEKLFEQLRDYHFSIIPSVWYDNMPNSYIESQAAGMPIIASAIGSLQEMTNEGVNGFLFESENDIALANTIKSATLLKEEDFNKMAKNSINWVSDYCSESKHYNKLIEVFNKAIKTNEKNIK